VYKLAPNGVTNTLLNAYIPEDSNNKDWQSYQEWLAQGNTPEPIETLQEKRSRCKQLVKQKVEKSIQAIQSDNGNLYDIALAVYLVDKMDRGLSVEEHNQLDSLRSKFITVLNIRNKEQEAYAAIDQAEDPDNISFLE